MCKSQHMYGGRDLCCLRIVGAQATELLHHMKMIHVTIYTSLVQIDKLIIVYALCL